MAQPVHRSRWTRWEGQIIDGRNRSVACKLADVTAQYVDADGGIEDPYAYVASVNICRRHLVESQRAMIGARLKEHYAEEAKERQGTKTDILENLPECSSAGDARDKAGAVVNVSGRSVDHASKVLAKGSKNYRKPSTAARSRCRGRRPPNKRRRLRGDLEGTPARGTKHHAIPRTGVRTHPRKPFTASSD